MKRALVVTVVLALALAGCSSSDASSSGPSGTPVTAAAADAFLVDHGLGGLDGQAIVDELERLGGPDRPADLKASVRPGELQLSDTAGGTATVALPDDLFYLAVAPYVTGNHDCFYHSLTTCQGELADEAVHVTVTQDDGTVLVDEQTTTAANGFVAYWVPRGSSGTVEIGDGAKTGRYAFTTDDEAPTCVTTLQLT